MTFPDDDMDRLKLEDNLIARIEALEQKVNTAVRSSIETDNLGDLSPDLGEIRMGRFLATSSDGDPTDPDFTGVFMSADPETFGNFEYHLGGVNQGALKFGLNADTGEADFISGNAHIGTDGIDVTDTLKWIVRQTATNSTYTRTAKIGMALPEGGGTIPCLEMSLTSPAGTELVVNGIPETDLTGWTQTTGTWMFFNGVFVCTDDAGLLTSDRIEVTESINYLISAAISGGGSPGGFVSVSVKWYDHASAGTLISTDLVVKGIVNAYGDMPAAGEHEITVNAPVGALSCSIILESDDQQFYGSFRDISMSAVTVNTKLQLRDDGVYIDGTAIGGGSYPRAWYSPIYLAKTSFTCAFSAVASQWGDYVWGPTAPNANDGDEYIFYIPLAAGSYTLSFRHMGNNDRGKIDCYWDGVKQGSTTDLYASSASYNVIVTFPITNLTDGQHTLMFKVNGKNASSSDYRVQGNDLWINNV